MRRRAGILLHPTSFPSSFGIGDIGPYAFQWIDTLVQCKQSLWQIFPLGPVGYGNSPYNCLSSFAANPLLISPVRLFEEGLLTHAELQHYPSLPSTHVDFNRVAYEKERLFRLAFSRFKVSERYEQFCQNERYWLHDFALFMNAKKKYNNSEWSKWHNPLKFRDPEFLREIVLTDNQEMQYHRFLQFIFHEQWQDLKRYATMHGVEIVGDVPYYTAYDSCDVWAHSVNFMLDNEGQSSFMGGVPPDYFSSTGQLWGNPVYDWNYLTKNQFAWWIKRIRKTLEMVDWLRIDHFRGFESYWAIPKGSTTAIIGSWVQGPGKDFFTALSREMGSLRLVAEDLGIITKEVDKLRTDLGLLGMRVLQFAFDGGSENPHRTFNIGFDSIIYTGTHDNPTTIGWFKNLDTAKKKFVCQYLGCSEKNILESLLMHAYSSPARWCIVPLQDCLGLDENHRMNTPGTIENNWQWRFTADMIDYDKLGKIAELTLLYSRA